MFERILCPVDGSTHAERALELAIDLAKRYEAGLVLLHALMRSNATSELRRFAEIEGLTERVRPEIARLQGMDARLDAGGSYDDRVVSTRVLVEVGQHLLDEAERDAKAAGLRDVVTVLADGDPADRILECVDERGIDCIVMGSRGLNDLKGLFLGSVSHKVAHRAPCTCITVK